MKLGDLFFEDADAAATARTVWERRDGTLSKHVIRQHDALAVKPRVRFNRPEKADG